MRTRLILCLVVALLCGACGGDGETGPGDSTPSEITGVITDVESTSLTEVQGFSVRSEGKTYDVLIDPEVDLEFPTPHLNEHRISGDPVTVELDSRDGKLYALSIADA